MENIVGIFGEYKHRNSNIANTNSKSHGKTFILVLNRVDMDLIYTAVCSPIS